MARTQQLQDPMSNGHPAKGVILSITTEPRERALRIRAHGKEASRSRRSIRSRSPELHVSPVVDLVFYLAAGSADASIMTQTGNGFGIDMVTNYQFGGYNGNERLSSLAPFFPVRVVALLRNLYEK